MSNVWDVLEIPRGSDRDTIRRAYAKKLRVTHPEDDPEGFKKLREAYEAALEQHDYAVRWADYDEDSDEEGDSDPAEPAPLDWSAPARPTESDDAPAVTATPELDSMLAEREEELASLRAAMADLETGLRGPWRPGDAVLEERLKAILASPAMGEIRIRDDVEPWLADLLASTIPHSDAVLMQSIQAFGWGSDDHHLHSTSWSISTVLGRLDEWRIIEGLNHHSHAYHAAWRSLTRPPGAWWSWRLDAFRPGMIDGVETLLGEHDEVSPGLHYSFKSEAVDRWRTFLAKPRLTLGMLAMMPIAFLATLWLGYVVAGTGAVNQAWLIGGVAAVGFATPAAILFTLAPWRKRWRAADEHPRWQREGWLAAYALLGFVAAALPRPWWPALILLPAMIVAAWTYVAAQRTEPGPLRIGGGAATFAVAAFFSLVMFDQLAPAEAFALGTMAALLVYLRIAAWPAVRILLEDLLWRHREWIILGSVVAGVGAAAGIWWLRSLWQPVVPFYPVALVAIALVPLIGAPDRGFGGPPRWIARILLILAFFWAFAVSVPPSKHSGRSNGVPLVVNGGLGTADSDMMGMEANVTGFSQVRQGNPELYAAIRAVMVRYRNNGITRDQANVQIGALVTTELRQRLPEAQTGPLVEWLRIRMDRLEALRRTSPALCASGKTAMDDAAVPERIRRRASAQTYDIISSPSATAEELAEGRVIGGDVLARRASTALRIDQAALIDRLDGKRGDALTCDAKIALTQALLDSERTDDIAATLRAEFRRARDAKPVRPQEKTGGRKVQPPA
jgi:hypothetical protein